jgi:hypothetical protein
MPLAHACAAHYPLPLLVFDIGQSEVLGTASWDSRLMGGGWGVSTPQQWCPFKETARQVLLELK